MIVDPMTSTGPYRDSYRDVAVHRTMLSDVVRTEAYERALRRVVKPGSKVLDFGCGTGILSIFTSRFGADTVYAVDRSSFITVAHNIAKANQIKNIRFFHDDHNSLSLPGKVDLIVSEWMGYFVFYEAMLDPLLMLRDRFLTDGGIMLPDRVQLTAGFVTEESFYEELSFFRQNPYGIDFSPIADAPLFQSNPEFFHPNQIAKTTVDLGSLDLYTLQSPPEALTGSVVPREVVTVYGLCGWFSARLTEGIHIGTGPDDPPTHWNQVFFPFSEPLELSPSREVSVRILPPKGDDYAWTWHVTDGQTTFQMDDRYPFDKPSRLGPLDGK